MQDFQSVECLANIIKRENIDVSCIAEIHKGRQMDMLLSLFPYSGTAYIDTKYWEFPNMASFFFGEKKSNAVIMDQELEVKRKYFSVGTKKLVYVVYLPKDVVLYFTHLSLGRNVREKQLQELSEMIPKEQKSIICGDFNIFYGVDELSPLCKKLNMNIISKQDTFPAYKPRFPLDTFIASKGIDINTTVLPDVFSDHLAVVATI